MEVNIMSNSYSKGTALITGTSTGIGIDEWAP